MLNIVDEQQILIGCVSVVWSGAFDFRLSKCKKSDGVDLILVFFFSLSCGDAATLWRDKCYTVSEGRSVGDVIRK